MTLRSPAPLGGAGPRPGHVPVEHRWFGFDRRTLGPAVAVLLLALLWAVVLPAIDEAVPQDREVEPGTVLDVGQDVTVVPPVGWGIESGLTVEDAVPAPPLVEVVSGATRVTVSTVTWDGTLAELLERVNEIHEDSSDPDWHVAGGQTSVTTDQGVTGISEPFQAGSRVGLVAAFLLGDVGVQFIASSSSTELGQHQREIQAMVASIRFGGAG
jgi:hypothetical protein